MSHLNLKWAHCLKISRTRHLGKECDKVKRIHSYHFYLNQSRLDWAQGGNVYRSTIPHSLITWKENNIGNSNFPTIVPGVDNNFKVPLPDWAVGNVKKGQVRILLCFVPYAPSYFLIYHHLVFL